MIMMKIVVIVIVIKMVIKVMIMMIKVMRFLVRQGWSREPGVICPAPVVHGDDQSS